MNCKLTQQSQDGKMSKLILFVVLTNKNIIREIGHQQFSVQSALFSLSEMKKFFSVTRGKRLGILHWESWRPSGY